MLRFSRLLPALVLAVTPLLTAPAALAQAQPPPLIIVVMENQGYADAVGNANMPYFNQLWGEGAAGTGPVTAYLNMYAVSHPSLPNYLAIASGSTQGLDGTDTISPGQITAPSIWDQLTAAGITWGVYEEGMPTTCASNVTYNDTVPGGTDGQYVLRHNPATPFAPVYTSAECQQVQPMSALNLAALPQVSFVAPNTCDDDHGIASGASDPYQNCVQGTAALLQRGDAWLQQHVTAWTGAGADVLITWDEGTGTAGANGGTGGGQMAAMLTGPGATRGQDAAQYSQYSVTAGIEKLYGLPYLANAASATPLPLPAAASPSAPVVSIAQPAAGSSVSGMVTVAGTAQAQGGASITGVTVAVDGQAPQPATGTTSWSASIDTTALANGPHTITAQATDSAGATGSASVVVTVSNAGATSCPATPAGMVELSGNVSLESSQNGWTGNYNANSALTRVQPAGGSYDGLWALQAALKPGTSGAAGVHDAKPVWVPGPPGTATTVGQSYTASAVVRANTAGEKISLTVRELAGTAQVGSHVTTVTVPDTGWHQISSAYTAKGTGNALSYVLYASNLASSSQNFAADCLSLQTAARSAPVVSIAQPAAGSSVSGP